MGRECSSYGGEERHIQAFGGEPEGKSPLKIPRRRWEDNIVMNTFTFFFSFWKKFWKNQEVQNEGKSYSSLGHEMFMLQTGTTCENADWRYSNQAAFRTAEYTHPPEDT